MKKGMLIKIGDDLFRVLDLQHVTPGNLRGFVRVRFRNIRTGTLSDQKLRSEDTVERRNTVITGSICAYERIPSTHQPTSPIDWRTPEGLRRWT